MRRITLALQGGGAHGAFTWGVLDRMLEEPDIEIAAISGTSAGAMNGAALKAGWIAGGRGGARENLDWLWERMGAIDAPGLPEWMGLDAFAMAAGASVAYAAAESWTRIFSPYASGPFYSNPLRRVAERLDYRRVCGGEGPQLFVGATNVRTGKIRIFTGEEITPDSILASACLPTLFRAVEINGAAYWDGGYAGNPALFPLFAEDLPPDILIVNINPLLREEVPHTPQDIRNRINEISFNAALLNELRAIAEAQRLLDQGVPETAVAMKRIYVHMIADDSLMNTLSVATKMIPIPQVMAQLKEAGRAAAARFLASDGGRIGHCGTADLATLCG